MSKPKPPLRGPRRYDTGRRLDYQLVAELRDQGWIAGRASSSDAAISVWAFHPPTGRARFVRIKSLAYTDRNDWEDAHTTALKDAAAALKAAGQRNIQYEVWLKYPQLGGIQKIILSGFEEVADNG
jgi:hypothetical protein